ncbi:unnamed protein product [Diatraea saccharalis]|uniref:Poly(A) polymerase nucleotidyltransferase domain-containing protein n=1 Tax=Diatraea saccharalis TaxID=40085 RepID=A0A9N9R670_9NEOP|nr:unnamed protein product [Diatraea saccharalis]
MSSYTTRYRENEDAENCLVPFDAFEPEAEVQHHMKVLGSVHRLVRQWICDDSLRKNILASVVDTVGGKLYTYGSYRHTRPERCRYRCIVCRPAVHTAVRFFTSFYAQTAATDSLYLSDNMLVKNLNQRCVRSINGCRYTDEVLRLVPNIDNFRLPLPFFYILHYTHLELKTFISIKACRILSLRHIPA